MKLTQPQQAFIAALGAGRYITGGNVVRLAKRLEALGVVKLTDRGRSTDHRSPRDKERWWCERADATHAGTLTRAALGRARGEAALLHLQAAKEQIEAAQRDMSRLYGANDADDWLRDIHARIRQAVAQIEYTDLDSDESYEVDSDPDDTDKPHSCGCDTAGSLAFAYTRSVLETP